MTHLDTSFDIRGWIYSSIHSTPFIFAISFVFEASILSLMTSPETFRTSPPNSFSLGEISSLFSDLNRSTVIFILASSSLIGSSGLILYAGWYTPIHCTKSKFFTFSSVSESIPIINALFGI